MRIIYKLVLIFFVLFFSITGYLFLRYEKSMEQMIKEKEAVFKTNSERAREEISPIYDLCQGQNDQDNLTAAYLNEYTIRFNCQDEKVHGKVLITADNEGKYPRIELSFKEGKPYGKSLTYDVAGNC